MKNISQIKSKSKTLLISSLILGATIVGASTFATAQEIDENAAENQTADLSDYPHPFVEQDQTNMEIVIGQEASDNDIEASILIHDSLEAAATDSETNPMQENRYDHFGIIDNNHGEDDLPETVKFDNEYQGDQNVILVGGPEVNTITSDLERENLTMSSEEYEEGRATIQLIPEVFNEQYDALVVAGETTEDTQVAAQVLADYEDFEEEMSNTQQLIIDTEEEEVVEIEDAE